MSVTALLIRRRDAAAAEWLRHARLARLLRSVPIGVHAETIERRARRRLALWDGLLDLWTRRGTRRV